MDIFPAISVCAYTHAHATYFKRRVPLQARLRGQKKYGGLRPPPHVSQDSRRETKGRRHIATQAHAHCALAQHVHIAAPQQLSAVCRAGAGARAAPPAPGHEDSSSAGREALLKPYSFSAPLCISQHRYCASTLLELVAHSYVAVTAKSRSERLRTETFLKACMDQSIKQSFIQSINQQS